MMFKAPPEDTLEWSDEGVEGAARFMRRLWRMVYEHVEGARGSGLGARAGAKSTQPSLAQAPSPTPQVLTDAQRALRRAAHATLAKVTDDLGRRRVFNTAIAAVMELMNTLAKFEDHSAQGRAVVHEALELIVQMLSPIVPHACHALWQALGHDDPLIDHPWPKPDPQALVRDTHRNRRAGQRQAARPGHCGPPARPRKHVRAAALADEHVQKWVEGKPVRKVIVVKGKLVNVVV